MKAFHHNHIALFLGYKSLLKSNKGVLLMTLLLITLTYVSLIFVSGFFSGVFSGVNRQITDTRSSDILIEPSDDDQYLKDVNRLTGVIRSLPGVTQVVSHYATGAIFSFDAEKNGQNIRSKSYTVSGVDPMEDARILTISRHMAEGSYLTPDDRDRIVIGVNVSGGYGANLEDESLKGVHVGDELTLRYANGVTRAYTVKGIFKTGFSLSDLYAFVTKTEMESVLGQYNNASEVLVKTDGSEPPETYVAALRRMGYTAPKIQTEQQYADRIVGDLRKTIGVVSGIISFINILVAGITIFIIIYINVTTKKRQIGILKAIGVDESVIIRSYMYQALFYAAVSITLGTAIVLSVIAPYIRTHPLIMPFGTVVLHLTVWSFVRFALVLFVISLVSSFVPSRRVTRVSILEAIWGN